MVKPSDGTWIGTFLSGRAFSVQIVAQLTFSESGAVAGSFQVFPSYPGNTLSGWTGPTKGEVDDGGYSPFGSLHFELNSNADTFGFSSFDGRYEVASRNVSVIFGTVLIAKGEQSETGVLVLTFSPVNEKLQGPAGGIWDS